MSLITHTAAQVAAQATAAHGAPHQRAGEQDEVKVVETRLLNALRNPQHWHLVLSLRGREHLFTVYQEIAKAYVACYLEWGTVTVDGVRAKLNGEQLPPELTMRLDVDPRPLLDDLERRYIQKRLAVFSELAAQEAAMYQPNIERLQRLLEQLTPVATIDTSISSGIEQLQQRVKQRQSGVYRLLSTGITYVDALIGGELPRSGITVITGKSGGGKTAVMGAIALNMARNHHLGLAGSPIAFFSLEMPKDQLVARFVAEMTGLDARVVYNGLHLDGRPWSDDERDLIKAAFEELTLYPMHIIDRERMTAHDFVRIATDLHNTHGVEVFFLDYAQLLVVDTDLGIHYGLTAAYRLIREFVKRYNVAVVMAAQIHEEKGTIRDGSDLNREASLQIHITMQHDQRTEQGLVPCVFEAVKNRHGPIGKIIVAWDTRRFRFVEQPHAGAVRQTT
jgi:replicative DNA helicase